MAQVEMTYVFGDVLTGAIVAEIPLYGVSMTRAMGAGEFRGSFQLDQTGQDNQDLLAATEPGRCYVVCERNAQPVWGGIVWTRTYQSQAKVCQLYCRAYEHYPHYRLIRSDFENLITEQRNIFRNLWTSMMSDPNSIQVALPSSFSTVVTKSLTVKAFEFKTFGSAMDSIANGENLNGFDWTIDVARVGGSYTRTLRVGYPKLGASEPLILYYPGDILNYWQNDSMAERGTHVFGIGAGEGSTMLVQPVTHSDLVTSGFPRYDTEVSFKDVNSATLLATLTAQAAVVKKANVPVLTVELKGDREPEFGAFGLGDAVKIYVNDPRHPEPSSQLIQTRILGWEYYPQSDEHVETTRLTFEGADV